jgi:predicted glycosyltransferase
MKRILFYSHDTYGLGHLKRVLAIARHLNENLTGISILIITGSGIINRIKLPDGIDYIKLPSVTKIGNEHYESKHLNIGINEILSIRQDIIFHTVRSFQPDMFVIDNVPMGLCNEAMPALELLKTSRPHTKIVLSMRDILDNPDEIKTTWALNNLYKRTDAYFDTVFIFGQKEIYNPVIEYDIPEKTAPKFNFCGYIKKSKIIYKPETIRNWFGVNGHPFVLITAGGGGDGKKLIEASLESIDRNGKGRLKSLVVLGPDYPREYEKMLHMKYRGNKDISIKSFVENLTDFINASDLVISMGGYNTICEILSLKKRAIVVPRTAPRTEQLIRAQLFHEKQLLDYIHPLQLDPDNLYAAIEKNLLMPPPNIELIDFKGLDNMLISVKELLN